MCAEQALDGGRPEPVLYLELDERNHGQLVLADPVIGGWLRRAYRLADEHQQVKGNPGPGAQLPKCLAGQR